MRMFVLRIRVESTITKLLLFGFLITYVTDMLQMKTQRFRSRFATVKVSHFRGNNRLPIARAKQ